MADQQDDKGAMSPEEIFREHQKLLPEALRLRQEAEELLKQQVDELRKALGKMLRNIEPEDGE